MDISHILLTKRQATYITGWAAAAAMHDEMAVAMVAAAVIEPHKGRQWGGLRKNFGIYRILGCVTLLPRTEFWATLPAKNRNFGRVTKFYFELSLY